jgi:hypothetical protein
VSSFSPSQFEAVVEKLAEGKANLPSLVQAALNRFQWESVLFGVTGIVVGQTNSNVMSRLGDYLEKIGYYLADSVRIPFDMYDYAQTWQTIGRQAATMATKIEGELATSEWGGVAGGAYSNAVDMQKGAVQQVSADAANVCNACNSIAACGLGFFMALLATASSIIEEVSGDVPDGFEIAAIIEQAIVDVAQAVVNLEAALKSQTDALNQVLWPNPAFPIYPNSSVGAWPVVTPS